MKKRIRLFSIMTIIIMILCGCTREIEVGNTEVNSVSELSEQELYVEFSPAYGDKTAAVTIISDDGFYRTGKNLNELAQKHNMHITVAGVVQIVNDDYTGWKEIVDDGYIDLVSHSYSHVKMDEESEISNNKDALFHEIVDADSWFEENFEREQICFVCPENCMCENGWNILRENGFYAVRKGDRGYNSLSPSEGKDTFDWFNLGVQAIGDVSTTEERNDKIDYAIQTNKWLIEMWHDVDDEDNGHFQRITVEEADEHLNYIHYQRDRGNIWVASFTEAVKYFREKENALIDIKTSDNKMEVSVSIDEEKYPSDIFDFPLTVRVYLPKQNSFDKYSYYIDNNQLKKKYTIGN